MLADSGRLLESHSQFTLRFRKCLSCPASNATNMAEENNTAQNVGGQQNGDSTNLDNPQRMAAEMAKVGLSLPLSIAMCRAKKERLGFPRACEVSRIDTKKRSFLISIRGEQTASALERQLDGIESRIDRLLAQAEEAANGTEVQDRVNGFPDNGTGRSSTK